MEARSDLSGQVDHQLRGQDWGWVQQMLVMLQCLARCREEVCEALKVKQEDVELSMGMSGDFEEAVSRSSSHACHVAVLTLGEGNLIGVRRGGAIREDMPMESTLLACWSFCNPALPSEEEGQ